MHTTTAPVSPLAPYGATLLRLALGVLFLVHALTKLLVFTRPVRRRSSSLWACPVCSATSPSASNW